MIIRKIKPGEYRRTSELFGMAFEFKVDNSKSSEEMEAELQRHPTARQEEYYLERWAAYEDDDETMMSFIVMVPHNLDFDGHVCKMSGVGGVSSLAQYRRRGGIRGCMEHMLRDTYEEGYAFSYLFPFSDAYYRKFGYVLCGEVVNYSIDLRSIKPFNAGGSVRLLEHGNCTDDIKKVYEDFKQGYNMMCEHDRPYDYEWADNADPASECMYTYVYYSAAGEPKGVMSFYKRELPGSVRHEDEHFDLECRRLMFSDAEGLRGLLSHCLAFTAYYDHLNFRLPPEFEVVSYVNEWALYPCKRTLAFNGMVRVQNVQMVLEMARYQGDGSLRIRVHDAVIPQNDGVFAVEFRDGKAVSVAKVEGDADIELDITDFSRFIVGTCETSRIGALAEALPEEIVLNAPLERIGKVFYKKPCYIAEYF